MNSLQIGSADRRKAEPNLNSTRIFRRVATRTYGPPNPRLRLRNGSQQGPPARGASWWTCTALALALTSLGNFCICLWVQNAVATQVLFGLVDKVAFEHLIQLFLAAILFLIVRVRMRVDADYVASDQSGTSSSTHVFDGGRYQDPSNEIRDNVARVLPLRFPLEKPCTQLRVIRDLPA